MKISNDLTDAASLAEIGARLSHRRLELQWTQAELAAQAGVAKVDWNLISRRQRLHK